jgi:predicted TIM-barrel fold metal-dependent hydrolase
MADADLPITDAHHHLWDLSVNDYPWLTAARREMLIGDPAPLARNYLLADFFADAANQNLVKSVHLEAGHSAPTRCWRRRGCRRSPTTRPRADSARHRGALPTSPRRRGADAGAALRAPQRTRHPPHREPPPRPDPQLRRPRLPERTRLAAEFSLLKRFGLSFDLQLYPAQMADGAALARENPDVQIVLNHTGMPIERTQAGYDEWRKA